MLSILKGDIRYFNKNAVPAWNDIVARVDSALEKSSGGVFVTTSEEKEILGNALSLAKVAIFDMLFHPDTGVIKSRVKKFDREAFFSLYAMVVLFLISTFKNIRPQKSEELKGLFAKSTDLSEECVAFGDEMDKIYKNNNLQIEAILQRISNYCGELSAQERSGLISAFRGLTVTFIDIL